MSETSPEHRVAMETHSLTVTVAELMKLAGNPDTSHLVARDFPELHDAHKQLGRLITRLATKEAAE